MTPDEEHNAINQTSDSLVKRDNTDPLDSDQGILPESDSKVKGDQSGESCSPNYKNKNNQTEMIIPTPEGTLRLFLFYRNIYIRILLYFLFFY